MFVRKNPAGRSLVASMLLVACLAGPAAAQSVFRQPVRQPVRNPAPSLSPDRARAPVSHRPFEMVDPATGRSVGPSAELTRPNGARVEAADYYAALNQFDRHVNARGYSLRGHETTIPLGRVPMDMGRLNDRAREMQGAPRAAAATQLPDANEPVFGTILGAASGRRHAVARLR